MTAPYTTYNRWIIAIPNGIIAFGTFLFLLANQGATGQLTDLFLSDTAGTFWQGGIVITHMTVFVLALMPPSVKIFRTLIVAHLASILFLLGYAAALFFSVPQGETYMQQVTTALSLALATILVHLYRAYNIENKDIVLLRYNMNRRNKDNNSEE